MCQELRRLRRVLRLIEETLRSECSSDKRTMHYCTNRLDAVVSKRGASRGILELTEDPFGFKIGSSLAHMGTALAVYERRRVWYWEMTAESEARDVAWKYIQSHENGVTRQCFRTQGKRPSWLTSW